MDERVKRVIKDLEYSIRDLDSIDHERMSGLDMDCKRDMALMAVCDALTVLLRLNENVKD